MIVKQLSLDGFRNYKNLQVEFSPNMNVICGENAQGKTNLVEAISYLSTGKSHRSRYDKELIGFDYHHAYLDAIIETRQREFHIKITLNRLSKQMIIVNGINLKKKSDLTGKFHSILFSPEDLSLVKDGASIRRRFLDDAICQLRPKYAEALQTYQRLLDHKTRILRDSDQKSHLLHVLDEFNDALAKQGAIIIHYRAYFIQKLSRFTDEITRDFSGGRDQLQLEYSTIDTNPFAKPSNIYPVLREMLFQKQHVEKKARLCLVGPHKDDVFSFINGRNTRQFASQGQSRTVSLSLKLAQRSLFHTDTNEWPVLILDDVLSELDHKRQSFVLERIKGGQIFVTGCEIPFHDHNSSKHFYISQGKCVK